MKAQAKTDAAAVLWNRMMECGNLGSFYISSHPPVVENRYLRRTVEHDHGKL